MSRQHLQNHSNPFDTAIYVRVKYHHETFFVICDEFEEVAAFKGRLVDLLKQTGSAKQFVHEEFSGDDIRLHLRNRVSNAVDSVGTGELSHLPRPAGVQRHGVVLLPEEARL